ncbi:MAG: addiction module protein [Gammaproteobacteria bacterium]
MVDTALLGEVKRLSAAERMEFISAVWESLDPNEIPVSDAEKSLLDARLEDREQNPHDQSTWAEVRERLKSRFR